MTNFQQISPNRRRALKVWNIAVLVIALLALIFGPKFCYFINYWEGKAVIKGGFLTYLVYVLLIIPSISMLLFIRITRFQFKYKLLVAIGVALCYLVIAETHFIYTYQAGRITFMTGFQDAIKEQVVPEHLRKWAIDILVRYEKDEITLKENSPFIYHKLPADEIPVFVSNMWSTPPVSVEIWSWNTHEESCIRLRWYLHGILIGKPDYRTDWEPFYIQQWVPGMYFFHIEQ